MAIAWLAISKAVNQLNEPVAASPMLLKEQASAFDGTALFTTVDLNQCYS